MMHYDPLTLSVSADAVHETQSFPRTRESSVFRPKVHNGSSTNPTGHSRSRRAIRFRPAHGFTLIETLVALVVLAFGLLALARVIARSSASEFEAVQRTQAMTIVQDMASRISMNSKNAAQYVGDYTPTGALEDCTPPGLSILQRDQCEWRNLLRGGNVLDNGNPIGAPMSARGCITSPAANVYVVAVAWQGFMPTAAPNSACGQGEFDQEPNRRVYSTVVQVAILAP